MPAPAEVSAPAGAPAEPEGALRVRPPSPLPPRTRIVVAVVSVVLLLVAIVLVAQARATDGDAIPGSAWTDGVVPRGAKVDDFERSGILTAGTEVEGFGTWELNDMGPSLGDGLLRSDNIPGMVATVDAGSTDVLLHAQVVGLGSGSALLVSSTIDGSAGLRLVPGSRTSWELRWEQADGGSELIETFDAPPPPVSVQIVRRGDAVKVTFGAKAYDAEVPSESAAGTFVGLAADQPGFELDLFGYLALPGLVMRPRPTSGGTSMLAAPVVEAR